MKDKRKQMRGRAPARPARTVAPAAAGQRVTLPRALSKLGFCSRTEALSLIEAGRVTVAGRVVRNAETWVDLSNAVLAVDGKGVVAEKHVYLMLNKPRGLVTTRRDPEGRPTVYDCLTDIDVSHLSPVGRLDKASEGLLLFTNDTVFAQALLDPETHVPKTYHVQADRLVEAHELEAMMAGVMHDGELLRAQHVSVLRAGTRNCWLEVVLDEGRNRQIRRMLEALGVECLRLVRVSIGGLHLGDLEKGAARALTEMEVELLSKAIS